MFFFFLLSYSPFDHFIFLFDLVKLKRHKFQFSHPWAFSLWRLTGLATSLASRGIYSLQHSLANFFKSEMSWAEASMSWHWNTTANSWWEVTGEVRAVGQCDIISALVTRACALVISHHNITKSSLLSWTRQRQSQRGGGDLFFQFINISKYF